MDNHNDGLSSSIVGASTFILGCLGFVAVGDAIEKGSFNLLEQVVGIATCAGALDLGVLGLIAGLCHFDIISYGIDKIENLKHDIKSQKKERKERKRNRLAKEQRQEECSVFRRVQ